MKRFFTFLIVVIVILSMPMIACEKNTENVKLKYYQSASEILPLLNNGNIEIALLPEPAVSNLKKMNSEKEWFSLSLQELYDSDVKAYPQAVMMIKESVLSTYPNIVNYISTTLDSGISWTKSNVDIAVSKINEVLDDGVTPSLKSNMSSQTIDNCNIYYESSTNAKAKVKEYIANLISLESKSAVDVADDYFYDGNVETKVNTSETLTVVCPDGAPALSIAKYINDNDDFGTGKSVEYKVVSSDKIASYIVKGSGDIVIIPVNASSKIYNANKDNSYKMVSVVTHGNLYIVSSTKITLNDLAGKTVGVIGQGLVPDLTFKCVLNKNKQNYEIAE